MLVGLFVGLTVGNRLASTAHADDLDPASRAAIAAALSSSSSETTAEETNGNVLASDRAAAAEYMSASIGTVPFFADLIEATSIESDDSGHDRFGRNDGQNDQLADGHVDDHGHYGDHGFDESDDDLVSADETTEEVREISAEDFVIVTRGEIGEGESLGAALANQGISSATIHLIEKEMRGVVDFRRSRPGDRFRLGQDLDGRVLDFRYSHSEELSHYLYWDGMKYSVREEETELFAQAAKLAGMVDSSFYGAVQALGEETALASEFARIFAWDIDFSRNVHPGDEFSILYERLYRIDEEGNEVYVRPGKILAGRYAGRVGDYTVVHYDDGEGRDGGSYFRPDGTSVQRAFLAAPLEYSRISSRFTRARNHPILNITRRHPGIDYAAPHGTPVYSVAEGTVEYKARAGASGNLVRIRHPGGYTSHYAHLSNFKSGLKVGDKVEQKQVIGYVGSTGLATGPHVCFRVKKNGEYVDPMKISSPAGAPVDGTELVHFEIVRDELLANLGQSPVSLADEAL
jgi:murein DD-endopeptidase MepM/ murein hydrolase activator NlpD